MPDFIAELNALLGNEHVSTDRETRRTARRGTWPVEVKWDRLGQVDDHLPAVVVSPANTSEIAAIMQLATRHKIAVIPVGGASGIVGGLRTRSGAIALTLRRLQDRELDPVSMTVWTGAGVNLCELETWLEERSFISGHFPQSMPLATVGGMVATNGAGTFSTKYGRMRDIVQALEIVMSDGRIVRTSSGPDSSTGPNLGQIFVGSEGTLGIVTRARLRVWPIPPTRILASYTVPSVEAGITAVREIITEGVHPALVRLYDADEASHLWAQVGSTERGPLLILGQDGRADITELELSICRSILERTGARFIGDQPAKHWFAHRFDWVRIPATNDRSGEIADAIEISAPWAQLPEMWRSTRAAIAPLCTSVESHLSHVYHVGGSVYLIFYAQAADDRAAIDLYIQILDRLLTASLDAGGSVSHHHGVGTAKISWLRQQLGENGFALLESLKYAWDADGLLSPGVLGLGGLDYSHR